MTHEQTLENSLRQSQDSLPHINFLALLFPAQQISEFVLNSLQPRSYSKTYLNNHSSTTDQLPVSYSLLNFPAHFLF